MTKGDFQNSLVFSSGGGGFLFHLKDGATTIPVSAISGEKYWHINHVWYMRKRAPQEGIWVRQRQEEGSKQRQKATQFTSSPSRSDAAGKTVLTHTGTEINLLYAHRVSFWHVLVLNWSLLMIQILSLADAVLQIFHKWPKLHFLNKDTRSLYAGVLSPFTFKGNIVGPDCLNWSKYLQTTGTKAEVTFFFFFFTFFHLSAS